MKQIKETNNGVKGTSSPSGDPSPGRDSVAQQRGPSRYEATANTSRTRKRLQWTIEDNKETMFCYYQSEPTKRGYRKRLNEIWQARNNKPNITEQNLADRAKLIQKKQWMTKVQLDEIKDLAEGKTSMNQNKEDTEPVLLQEPPSSTVVETRDEESENPKTPIPDNVDEEIFEKVKRNFEKLKEVDIRIPNIKRLTSKQTFSKIVKKANEAANYIKTNNITDTMKLIKAVIITVAEEMGLELANEPKKKQTKRIPPWKYRMEKTIKSKRSDLSQLSEMKHGKMKNGKIMEYLTRKYLSDGKRIEEQIEIMKQEITALKSRNERYTARCEFYRQNKLFETNQKRFYDNLTKKPENDDEKKSPDKKKVVEFWNKIWGNTNKHNSDAEWIKEVEDDHKGIEKQNDLKITVNMTRKAAKKMKNWRTAGLDGIQGFWLKNLTSIHERLADQLQLVLDGNLPEWMVTGKTSLIIKDPSDPTKVSNYRPITCLPTIWKLLTSIIADQIYTFLEANNLIPWQQKGNKRKSRGTKDQLLIDKLIVTLAKRRKRNLRMVWIDYKKAYDSVPHSWILKCLKMFGIADNIISFLEQSMVLWQTELFLNEDFIGKILIKCGIFQGDSLSPLLFIICLIPLSCLLSCNDFGFKIEEEIINHLLYMDDLKLYAKSEKDIDSLVNTARIFSEDINMNFGLEKCAKVTIKRGKKESGHGITLPEGKEIKNLEIEEEYKYLGLLESDEFNSTRIKEKAKQEYKKRLRLILKSKLHGRNQITAINTYALPILTYPAGIIKYTVEEKKTLDTMTRKQFTMHGSLHPRADVDRLYLPRDKSGRGLLSVEDSINKEQNALAFYVHNTEEPILKLTKTILLNTDPKPKQEFADELEKERTEKWTTKKLHGVWPNNLKKYSPKSNQWLQKSNLKPATESLITSAQDQSLRTKWHETHILKVKNDDLCRQCGKFKETVAHIVSGCPELAQGVYLDRHNAVASYAHWKLCCIEKLPRHNNWYDHIPEKVVENEEVKILYDFNIMTDKKIKHRRPDLVIHKKKEKKTILVDFSCPMDHNVEEKEEEKVKIYQELKFELQRLWKTEITIVPIIIGALGTVTPNLENYLKKIKLEEIKVHQLQKCVLLKTGNIIRKHLSI